MAISLALAAANLSTAMVLGALIGSERQLRQRMAGLRTNALVALGAAGFVIYAQMVAGDASPTRVAAQGVSGIGFLGAGIIFRDGFTISGLNTAATLWCSAGVGLLSGSGQWLLAALLTGHVVFINFGLRPVVRWLKRLAAQSDKAARQFRITLTCRADQEIQVRSLMVQAFALAGMHLGGLESGDADQANRVVVEALVTAQGATEAGLEQVVGRLSLDPSVSSVRWRREDDI